MQLALLFTAPQPARDSVWSGLGNYMMGAPWPESHPAFAACSTSPETGSTSKNCDNPPTSRSDGGATTNAPTTFQPTPTPTTTSDAAFVAARHRAEVRATYPRTAKE